MKLINLFRPRKWIELYVNSHKAKGLSDEKFLKLKFYAHIGKKLNLKTPKTYNEKLQWLKLYDRKPIYTIMADKYEAKQYIANIIGEEYLVKNYGVWDSFDEIDFDSLPNQFVLKTNHDCGGVIICKDKSKLDIETAREKLNKSLNRDYYITGREWPYKDIKRKILAEEYLEDSKYGELRDYKFFAFDGQVELMFIASDRQSSKETKFDFYDMDFNHIDMTNGHPYSEVFPDKPEKFEEMKELACKLSKGFPHLRVDFYEVNGKVYVGELTFYHWSGFVPFEPKEWDGKLGEYLNLPNITMG